MTLIPQINLDKVLPADEIVVDDTVVKFQLQAIDTNEQPLTDANLKASILTPAKFPRFASKASPF